MKPIELDVFVLNETQEVLEDAGISVDISVLETEKRLFTRIDWVGRYCNRKYDYAVIGAGDMSAVVDISYEKLKQLILKS